MVSLAAIFTVPFVTDSSAPFPDRDLLLFCTLVVVLVTLIGQGITFGPLVGALGLRADATDELRLRNRARAAAVQAALDRLDSLDQQDDVDVDPRVIDGVRQQLSARLERYQHRLDLLSDAAEAPAASLRGRGRHPPHRHRRPARRAGALAGRGHAARPEPARD